MIELSPEITTVIMLGGILVGILSGYPLAIPIGALGLILGYAILGPSVLNLMYTRLFVLITSYVLLAAPLFIFMGVMLERSAVAEKMFDALYLWLGGLRGGLAVTTVLLGTILAACVGIIGASVTMLSLLALPAMVNRGYSKSLAAGSVCAGGTLGILIPPSIMLVIYGPMAEISVGKLFFGAFGPGLLLSALYLGYILLRGLFQPEVAPALPAEERAAPFIKKTTALFTSLVPPALLIAGVLGVIFLGIAAPTEAAGSGAFIATLLAIAYRKFSWTILGDVSLAAVKLCGFIFVIASCSVAFTAVFLAAGGGDVVREALLAVPGGRWGTFATTMFIMLVLGMFISWMGILFIMVPIITPIGAALGFDPLWFSVMMCVNLQMSFMTPPYAVAIFVCRGAAAPELGVTINDIIRGVIPFVILIMVGIGLCIAFPQTILWLPHQMIKF